jgi:putative transposase
MSAAKQHCATCDGICLRGRDQCERQHRRPNAVACVERDLDALLNFFAVPQAHWIKVRTTNVIERAFREVRRRTRPMSSFSNVESCDRIVYGVTSHLNRSWERKPLFKFTQIC